MKSKFLVLFSSASLEFAWLPWWDPTPPRLMGDGRESDLTTESSLNLSNSIGMPSGPAAFPLFVNSSAFFTSSTVGTGSAKPGSMSYVSLLVLVYRVSQYSRHLSNMSAQPYLLRNPNWTLRCMKTAVLRARLINWSENTFKNLIFRFFVVKFITYHILFHTLIVIFELWRQPRHYVVHS